MLLHFSAPKIKMGTIFRGENKPPYALRVRAIYILGGTAFVNFRRIRSFRTGGIY